MKTPTDNKAVTDSRTVASEGIEARKEDYLRKVRSGEIKETSAAKFQRLNFPLSFWHYILITGETREEMHAKRTKYTPQISANHCPNCGRKLSDCNGNCIFDEKRTIPAETATHKLRSSGKPTAIKEWDPEAVETIRDELLTAKAHAARLAEALGHMIRRHKLAEPSASCWEADKAAQALAAYESEVQP